MKKVIIDTLEIRRYAKGMVLKSENQALALTEGEVQALQSYFLTQTYFAPTSISTQRYDIQLGKGKGATRKGKTLTAFVSENSWSYIKNEKGNAYCTTLQGWGSCTPQHVLQDFINHLTDKQFLICWKQCEKSKEKIV